MSFGRQLAGAIRGVERGAWMRFFAALVGLLLAFASALLSSASREAGDGFATTIFASFALLLSGAVALFTVPYLARRVAVPRVGDALNYDVTREGIVYLVLTLLIGVAALNTGNNMLFIVVAAMLGALLVSGIVSAVMISGIEVGVHLPHQVFAGQSYAGAVLLHNRRRLPVFSISVVPPAEKPERGAWHWQRTEFVYPSPRSGRRAIIRWPDFAFAPAAPARCTPPVFAQSIYFPYLPAGYRQSAELKLCFPCLGYYAQRAVGVSTRFPFSFVAKTRTVALSQEVLVYPSVEPTDEMLQVLPLITGEMESYQRGRGADLYRIRDYGPGDSARHVDWKASAKSGELKVREYAREDERSVCIVFDNPAPGVLDEAQYERAVHLAASIGWHFFRQNSDLSFAAPGLFPEADIHAFLEYLALAAPCAPENFLATLGAPNRYNIIITAAPRGSIPTPLWLRSWVMFAQE